jgi:hypothetical protein
MPAFRVDGTLKTGTASAKHKFSVSRKTTGKPPKFENEGLSAGCATIGASRGTLSWALGGASGGVRGARPPFCWGLQPEPPMQRIVLLAAILVLTGCANLAYYHHQTTAELKLHHLELTQQLSGGGSHFYFSTGPLDPDPRDIAIAELRHTDDELLRRWQAGDQGAFLPEFQQ